MNSLYIAFMNQDICQTGINIFEWNSTFGNLECTTDWLEVLFIIIVLTTGLLLVTMLIGNIKVISPSELLVLLVLVI